MRIRFLFLALVVFLKTELSFAEGFPIREGHFEGNVSTLDLAPEQMSNVPTDKSKFARISLGASQRQILARDTGRPMEQMPTTIQIFFAEAVKDECTCGAANLGLLIEENQIEVPHLYVMSDDEAKDREITD